MTASDLTFQHVLIAHGIVTIAFVIAVISGDLIHPGVGAVVLLATFLMLGYLTHSKLMPKTNGGGST